MLLLPTDVLISEYLGDTSHLVGNGVCFIVVRSWPLAGFTGVFGVSNFTMGVTLGNDITIRFLFFNTVCVGSFYRNGSVGRESFYFFCDRCENLWVGDGQSIGLVLSFVNVVSMVSYKINGCVDYLASFSHNKVTSDMCHGVVRSFLS